MPIFIQEELLLIIQIIMRGAFLLFVQAKFIQIKLNFSITEERRRVIGKVGKVLFVVYTERTSAKRTISAREATDKEKVRYYAGKRSY